MTATESKQIPTSWSGVWQHCKNGKWEIDPGFSHNIIMRKVAPIAYAKNNHPPRGCRIQCLDNNKWEAK